MSPYEVLDVMDSPCGEEKLQVSFTASNGIRIAVWNHDLADIASFDLTREQALLIGAKLVDWANMA